MKNDKAIKYPLVKCDDCKFYKPTDHPILKYCEGIHMVQPVVEFRTCLIKQKISK